MEDLEVAKACQTFTKIENNNNKDDNNNNNNSTKQQELSKVPNKLVDNNKLKRSIKSLQEEIESIKKDPFIVHNN